MTRKPADGPGRPLGPESEDDSADHSDNDGRDDRPGTRRRSLLRGVGAAATAVGVGFGVVRHWNTPDSGIVDVSSQHGVVPDRERSAGRTVVRFDEELTSVQLTGRLGHGSERCELIGVREATFDSGRNRLRVVVAPIERDDRPRACQSSMDYSWYQVTIRFASSLPRVVRVVERGPGEKSRNRTVKRRRQARRCRRETYENESLASTAHWTCPDRYVAVAGTENDSADTQ